MLSTAGDCDARPTALQKLWLLTSLHKFTFFVASASSSPLFNTGKTLQDNSQILSEVNERALLQETAHEKTRRMIQKLSLFYILRKAKAPATWTKQR